MKDGCKKSVEALCPLCVTGEFFKNNPEMEWLQTTPMNIRDAGMIEAINAYKSNFVLATNDGRQFEIHLKEECNSCEIRKNYWYGPGIFYPESFGRKRLRAEEPLPEKLPHDSRLIRDHKKRFFLCVPENIVYKPEKEGPKEKNIASIDPGIRKFLTVYSPNGSVFIYGDKDIRRLERIQQKSIDRLEKIACDRMTSHKTRYRIRKKALPAAHNRIRNLRKDLHHKIIKRLCEENTVILLPEFRTKQMVKRDGRNIRPKTVKQFYTWGHYLFRKTFLEVVREYPWVTVYVVTEEYTSKTCGQCGFIHNKLGSKKVYSCPECKFTVDRDMNGARNILLKFLTERNEAEVVREFFKNQTRT